MSSYRARASSLGNERNAALLQAFGVFAARAFCVLASFLLSALIGRLTGTAGLGLYSIGLSVVAFLSAISRWGQPTVAVRYGSILYHENKIASLGVLARKWFVLVFATGAFVSFLVIAVKKPIIDVVFGKPGLEYLLVPMLLVVPFFSLNLLNCGLLKLSGRPFFAMLLEAGGIWIASLIILGMIFFLNGEIGLDWLGVSYLLSGAIVSAVGIYCLRDIYFSPALGARIEGEGNAKQASLEFTLVHLATFAQMWLPAMLIGVFLDARDAGLFNAAVRCAMLFMFITVVFASIVPPKLAVFHEKGMHADFSRTIRHTSTYVSLAMLPLLVIFLSIPSFVMGLFGEEFREGASLLVVLSIGRAIFSVGTSAQFLLMMAGLERDLRNITLFAAFLLTILCVLFIDFWGVMGAAIAVSVSLVIQAILCVGLARFRTGIWALPFC